MQYSYSCQSIYRLRFVHLNFNQILDEFVFWHSLDECKGDRSGDPLDIHCVVRDVHTMGSKTFLFDAFVFLLFRFLTFCQSCVPSILSVFVGSILYCCNIFD